MPQFFKKTDEKKRTSPFKEDVKNPKITEESNLPEKPSFLDNFLNAFKSQPDPNKPLNEKMEKDAVNPHTKDVDMKDGVKNQKAHKKIGFFDGFFGDKNVLNPKSSAQQTSKSDAGPSKKSVVVERDDVTGDTSKRSDGPIFDSFHSQKQTSQRARSVKSSPMLQSDVVDLNEKSEMQRGPVKNNSSPQISFGIPNTLEPEENANLIFLRGELNKYSDSTLLSQIPPVVVLTAEDLQQPDVSAEEEERHRLIAEKLEEFFPNSRGQQRSFGLSNSKSSSFEEGNKKPKSASSLAPQENKEWPQRKAPTPNLSGSRPSNDLSGSAKNSKEGLKTDILSLEDPLIVLLDLIKAEKGKRNISSIFRFLIAQIDQIRRCMNPRGVIKANFLKSVLNNLNSFFIDYSSLDNDSNYLNAFNFVTAVLNYFKEENIEKGDFYSRLNEIILEHIKNFSFDEDIQDEQSKIEESIRVATPADKWSELYGGCLLSTHKSCVEKLSECSQERDLSIRSFWNFVFENAVRSYFKPFSLSEKKKRGIFLYNKSRVSKLEKKYLDFKERKMYSLLIGLSSKDFKYLNDDNKDFLFSQYVKKIDDIFVKQFLLLMNPDVKKNSQENFFTFFSKDFSNKAGGTFLDVAVDFGNVGVIDILLPDNGEETLDHTHVVGKKSVVSRILECFGLHTGYHPIERAVIHGDVEMVAKLCKKKIVLDSFRKTKKDIFKLVQRCEKKNSIIDREVWREMRSELSCYFKDEQKMGDKTRKKDADKDRSSYVCFEEKKDGFFSTIKNRLVNSVCSFFKNKKDCDSQKTTAKVKSETEKTRAQNDGLDAVSPKTKLLDVETHPKYGGLIKEVSK